MPLKKGSKSKKLHLDIRAIYLRLQPHKWAIFPLT